MPINIKNLKYSKRCVHCKYMKKKPGYTYRVFNSKYFNSQGQESLPDVWRSFGVDMHPQTIYNCLKRHFKNYKPAVSMTLNGDISQKLAATEGLLEGRIPLNSHEVGLEEFISQGREMVRRGEMAITASNYITAIKVKSEIDRTNKDRKLDLLKTMFSGAAPKDNEA